MRPGAVRSIKATEATTTPPIGQLFKTRIMSADHDSDPAARRERLRAILKDQALITGRSVKLSSGGASSYYFNVKRPLFDPEAASLIGDAMLERLKADPPDLIGGMALGAVPIVAAVCVRSHPDMPLRGFFVRKEARTHGTGSLIEGYFHAGARVVLLEDVTTTGGSTLEAARAVRAAGGEVAYAIVVIDRLEGAREALAAEGIDLIALFTRDDFSDADAPPPA
ncbi:MAG: orotate phosphoribosyltransferase [Rhodospirillales bacterium]|nr:MAG: orotate phosphoribosyltransferase [Rhodospirillales bacterium]